MSFFPISNKLRSTIANRKLHARQRLLIEQLEGRDLPAPLTWAPGVSLATARGGVVADLLGGEVAVFGGGTTAVPALSITNPTWQAVLSSYAPQDNALSSQGIGVLPGGYALLVGGSDGGTAVSEVSQYDYTGDNTATVASLHTPRALLGSATDQNYIVYAIGGINASGTPLSSVEAYTQSTKTWALLASLPQTLYSESAVADTAGNIFTFGGVGANGAITGNVYEYNIAANTWSQAAPMPIAVRDSAAVLASNGLIYVLGGNTSSGTTAAVESYNPSTNTWNTEASLPNPVSSEAVVSDWLGRIEILGGYDATGAAVANTWISQQLNQPDAAPVITSSPITQIPASGIYNYQVLSTGNPQPTYSLTAFPTGMSINSVTGLISWTPTASQVGTFTVTVQANNFAGQAAQTLSIQIVAPTITTAKLNPATANVSYTAQTQTTGNPTATFTLSAAPAGMSINSSGVLSWTPTVSQIGNQTLTVVASNFVGQASHTFTIGVIGLPPDGVSAMGASTTSVTVSWSPVSDSAGATYNVYQRHTVYRSVYYTLIASDVSGTSYTVGGLHESSPGSAAYGFAVTSVDNATGLESARSTTVFSATLYPPILYGVSVNGADVGTVNVTEGYSVQAQVLYYANETPVFSITSGPGNASINSATGLITYSPTHADYGHGLIAVVVQATNSVGSATETVDFNVLAAPTIVFSDGPFTFNGYPYYATATAIGTDGVTPVNGTFTFYYSGPSNPPSFAGTYLVTAYFTSGDSNYGNVTATSTMIINPAQAVFGGLLSPTISVGTASVTLSGSLTNASLGGPASGTVNITLNGVTQSAPLTLPGDTFSATFDTTGLVAGAYPVTYVYVPGDTDFAAQDGASTVYVGAQPTTTTVASSANPSVFGQTVTFTATVNPPGTGAPTGTVTFLDGGATLGTVALSGGSGMLSTSVLAVGNHGITVSYGGDANFNASTSTAFTQTVNQGNVTTAIASQLDPSVFGQAVTLTATVSPLSPAAGTPSGTVSFLDGAATLGTVSLSSGSATLTISLSAAGNHTITASYAGDANFSGGLSTAITQTVTNGSSSTTATSSVNSSVFGQGVIFTATVMAVTPAVGTPTGSVSFLDGITTIGTASLSSGSGTFATSTLIVGNHTVTAVYSGDPNFNGGTSVAITQTVVNGASSTTLTSSANPSLFGQAVSFTATVSAVAPAAGTATGTVTFLDGTAALGSASLSGGLATFTTSGLSVGTHPITASFSGGGGFNGSTSRSVVQTVNKDGTTTTLTSSPNPSTSGEAVTFTATVSAAAPGSGIPAGTVTFMSVKTTLAAVTLDNTGHASFTTNTLPIGTSTITAIYNGSTNYLASRGTTLQTVGSAKVNTTTSLVSSLNPSTFGQTITFTATVLPASGTVTPTGTVQFVIDGSNFGSAVSLSGGTAAVTTSSLAVGTHSISASYSGSSNFNSSTGSLAGGQTVNQSTTGPGTTTAVTSSANPAVFGQLVTFAATVSANSGSGTPTGAVTFFDGATSIAAATLNSGTASFASSSLAVGSHSITVTYGGDANFTSSSSGVLVQSVNKAGTSTTLASSLNPSSSGQSVTFTASVAARAPGAGTPTGTVSFLAGKSTLGTTTLDSSGHATFATSSLPAGTSTVTATYNGDGNFLTSTGSMLQTVGSNKSNTTTALASSLNPSAFGQAVTFTATVTSTGSGTPTGTVTFSDGKTSLGSSTLNSSGVATFTTSSLSVANHTITARYNGDNNFNSSTSSNLTQTVSAAAIATMLGSDTSRNQAVRVIDLVRPLSLVIAVPPASTTGGNSSTAIRSQQETRSIPFAAEKPASDHTEEISTGANKTRESASDNTPVVLDAASVDRFFGLA
jgi:hypothetical protein